MHTEDGSSLPLGSQLYWFLQLQVLPQYAVLRFRLPFDDSSDLVPGYGGCTDLARCGLQSSILRDDSIRFSSHLRVHHHRVLLVPSVDDQKLVHYH